uniref:ubiquitinyl hydrolase 1 n=1 Tax=Lotharella oceanica TaxID=641309 RepID=A0A7S2TRN7_9EUKA|mmetsp:Transcript_23935/g.44738  ORF Transcript_23935/g.44738 Transcript_23935/m.44738 type:complete len:211 (+) Transcript_23935:35-667(+)
MGDRKDHDVYHERQSWQFCGIHAVNNLLQRQEFKKADFDRIAKTLAPNAFVNPHRSIWGTGNYDVNVLTMAMQEKDYDIRWFDRRKDPSVINLDEIIGFIINTKTPKFFSMYTSHHWFAVRVIKGKWTKFDSKNKIPTEIEGGIKGLHSYIKQLLAADSQVLIACNKGKGDVIYKNDSVKPSGGEKKQPQAGAGGGVGATAGELAKLEVS